MFSLIRFIYYKRYQEAVLNGGVVMEAIRQYKKVPKGHKIVLDIPKYIETDQIAEIVIIFNKKSKKKYPIEEAMSDPLFLEDMNEDYSVLCYQIRTVDKSRLIKKFGSISSIKIKNEVLESLSYQLNIEGVHI